VACRRRERRCIRPDTAGLQGLFFPGTDPSSPHDVYPAGDRHDATDSGPYSLVDWTPRLRTRADWGAVAPNGPLGAVAITDRTEYIVHYTAGPTTQTVRAIQNNHLAGRAEEGKDTFSDIGYNFLVDVAGNVFEGRGRDVEGAHCRRHNGTGIGVAFIGLNGNATPRARWSIRRLWEGFSSDAGHPLAPAGHRDRRQTVCPGNALHRWIRQGMPPQ
jgi:hypothetical protein